MMVKCYYQQVNILIFFLHVIVFFNNHHCKYLFLLTGPDRSILLWDPKRNKPVSSLKEHKNKVYYANFNENSKYIASGVKIQD